MNERPPLWTWAAAIGLAGVVLGSLLLVQERRKTAYFHLERLERHDNRPLIVAIGSSQLYCALPFDAEMSRELSRRGRAMRFVRISGSNMSLADLRRFWRPLIAARPAMVIMEANMVSFKRAPPTDWRTELRQRLESRLPWGRRPMNPKENDATPAEGCKLRLRIPHTMAGYRADVSTWLVSTSDEIEDFVDHVRELEAQGTSVTLLSLPRNPRYVPWFPLSLRQRGDRVLQQVQLETRTSRISGFPQLEPEYFIDAGHLRASGEKIFSAWLADHVAQSIRPTQ